MGIYRLFNLNVEAEINLTEKLLQKSVNPDYKILKANNSPINKNYIRYHTVYDNKRKWLSFSKYRNNFGIRFHNYADFNVNSKTNEICFYKRKNTGFNTLRHLINDQVLPFALSLNNKSVFHASTVKICDSAVSFHAPSGFGKSTLAAYFSKMNHEILSDDSLLLEYIKKGVYAYPSYAGIRLWPEMVSNLFDKNVITSDVSQYNSKKLLDLKSNGIKLSNGPILLKAIYFISESDSNSIENISKSEAFSQMIKNIFRLDFKNKKTNSVHFKHMNKILNNVETYRLNYKKEFDSLKEIYELILEKF